MDATLHIRTLYDEQTVELGDELSIGRTDAARLVLDDPGLSRLNTTFFRDGDDILVTDENSTNGTFVNGERVAGRPRAIRDGDEIKIGSNTTIRVSFGDRLGEKSEPAASQAPTTQPVTTPPSSAAAQTSSGPPLVLIAAALMTLLILVFGGLGILYVSTREDTPGGSDRPPQQISSSALIPVRVIDPLGAEDEDDLDDLIASWEVAEEEIKADEVADVAVESADAEDKDLNVTSAFLKDRQAKALEDRPGDKGISPAGLVVPAELRGDGVIKQKRKLAEMNSIGYAQPMDFAELAAKRLDRTLIEMPMAAESFYLDVGGSAQDKPFSSFSFKDGSNDIVPGMPKYDILSRLAGNFAGQRYSLDNPTDRRQMRMRLLRMFNPKAKPILKELADAYFKRFGRPLRVTSLTRSMDYQILLNQGNANSFKVRGEGSLPPHTSGCAFDLARKHMPAEEQNFVMKKLSEMENAGKLDALIEYGANACFHVFIYDGPPPRM